MVSSAYGTVAIRACLHVQHGNLSVCDSSFVVVCGGGNAQRQWRSRLLSNCCSEWSEPLSLRVLRGIPRFRESSNESSLCIARGDPLASSLRADTSSLPIAVTGGRNRGSRWFLVPARTPAAIFPQS